MLGAPVHLAHSLACSPRRPPCCPPACGARPGMPSSRGSSPQEAGQDLVAIGLVRRGATKKPAVPLTWLNGLTTPTGSYRAAALRTAAFGGGGGVGAAAQSTGDRSAVSALSSGAKWRDKVWCSIRCAPGPVGWASYKRLSVDYLTTAQRESSLGSTGSGQVCRGRGRRVVRGDREGDRGGGGNRQLSQFGLSQSRR